MTPTATTAVPNARHVHVPKAASTPAGPVNSESLFHGAVELLIEHHGALYRLRQTQLGKLILTK